MKKLLAITLIMFICLSKAHSSEDKADSNKLKKDKKIEKSKSSALKSNLRSENKTEKKAVKKAENNGENKTSQAAPATSPATIYVNSLGHEVDSPMIVNKAPYKLERCDQIAAFEADYVPDLEDFTKRQKGYFTVTAYHLNRFETKDIAKLEQSLLFTNSRVKPSEPQGAESCLLIDGGDYEKPLLLCLTNKEEFENTRNLLETLDDCRAGRMIGKATVVQNPKNNNDKPALTDIVKKCGLEEGSSINPDAMLKEAQEKKKEERSPSGEEEFWVPAGDKVPGAPKEKDQKK
jgi:hypothetical protein